MTPKEQRTVRYATIGIAVYLALYFGYQAWNYGAKKQVEYQRLVVEAKNLKTEIKRYDDKIAVVKKLMDNFHMDPAKLSRSNIVAEASSAIQQAAAGGGFQLGPIRETATRSSSRELGSIQFEGTGPIKAATGLLQRLNTLGYPLVIDSAQLSANPTQPGQLKLKLTVVILDFEQWKTEGVPHA